jgi:arabinogalactan endo-1,4-beta-galactosidase
VRLKLWHTPEEGYSGFEDVKTFAEEIKAEGLKVWLTVHYSDTWADPGHQITPAAWQGLTFEEVQDSMYNYTARIINEIHPDFIQIGNETNPGILFPHGKISSNQAQFMSLMATGLQAVRDNDPEAKTIIHFAGTSGSTWYFDIVGDLDFDIIGLSYYPFTTGKIWPYCLRRLITWHRFTIKMLLLRKRPIHLRWTGTIGPITLLEVKTP